MSFTTVLGKPSKDLNGMQLHYIGDVAVIVMDDGENRLNASYIKNINELLDDVERNQSCKGLITTGKGKFYGNGLDLEYIYSLSSDGQKEYFSQISAMMMRLLLFPVPTLAAINGHAFAGGAFMAILHDLRVQRKDKGWFCFNEVWINRQFIKFHHVLMRTKIGGMTYTDACVLGRRYTGQEALDSGIVHAITGEATMLTQAIHLLKSHYGKTGYPRESLRLMKQDVYREVIMQAQLDEADREQGLINVVRKSNL